MVAKLVRFSPSAVTVYFSGSAVICGRESLSFMSSLVSFLTLPTASTLLFSPYKALSSAYCFDSDLVYFSCSVIKFCLPPEEEIMQHT